MRAIVTCLGVGLALVATTSTPASVGPSVVDPVAQSEPEEPKEPEPGGDPAVRLADLDVPKEAGERKEIQRPRKRIILQPQGRPGDITRQPAHEGSERPGDYQSVPDPGVDPPPTPPGGAKDQNEGLGPKP